MKAQNITIANFIIRASLENVDNSRPDGKKKQPYNMKIFKDKKKIKSCYYSSKRELNKGLRLVTTLIEKSNNDSYSFKNKITEDRLIDRECVPKIVPKFIGDINV